MRGIPGKDFFSIFVPAAAISALALGTLANPAVAVRAAVSGLALWWDAVLPALLPFFILSEMLLSLGVVHWLGRLLDPLMRPVFNVPGAGGFALAMGLSSGYPMGPRLAARLRQQGLASQVEGERLAAFTNCAGPLFITGAVAVGLFHDPSLAGPLAIAHYCAALCTGLAMRFWGRDDRRLRLPVAGNSPRGTGLPGKRGLLACANSALVSARRADPRPFGQVLADSVRDGVNVLMGIGGFILIFSVVVAVLTNSGALSVVDGALARLLHLFGASPALARPIITGVFEVTAGSGLLAESAAPLWERALAESALLAWAGFCVHSQARSAPGAASLRYAPFLAGRLLQAMLAVLFTALFLGPWHRATVTLGDVFHVPVYTSPGALVLSTARMAINWLAVLLALAIAWHALSALARRVTIIIFRPVRKGAGAGRHPRP